jgi:hypothetical protein
MPDSLSTYGADQLLTTLTTAVYVQLHTGDPGSAGTSNVSSVTTRKSLTWGTAASGAVAISNIPTWSNWAGTNGEVVTDISLWDALTGGNFWDSIELTGTPYAFTCPAASPGVFTAPGSSFTNGQQVLLAPQPVGALPTGFSSGTPYYVVSASGATFELSATSGGSGINATAAGSGIVALVASETVNTGDTLALQSLSVSLPTAS